ncbi:MAG: permease prefix domain 1-containing protein [Candidatus Thorarchaeota archaeon]
MSEENMNILIDEYLKEVKTKLPDWLKEKKEDEEILEELEEHLRNKAEELSDTGQPTIESVQSAIDHMGTPESIAKEYKRRGTPKVFITEELWPYYKKALLAIFSLIITITLIVQLINFIFGIASRIGDVVMGFHIGMLAAFALVSVIFTVLSMEGYFPEDFSAKPRKNVKKIPSMEERRKVKPFIKPGEEIFGGAFSIGVGIIFLVQPIPGIISLVDPLFLLYLKFAGLFIIAEGVLNLIRGLIGNRQMTAHQVIHGITIVVKFASISVIVLMVSRPDVFPILVFSGGLKNIGVKPEFYGLFRGIAGLFIALVALSTIEDFVKIFRAEKYKLPK